nr:hypothetical protein [Bacteroidota bacterium]
MQTKEISKSIVKSLGKLSYYQQRKLLEFINSLVIDKKKSGEELLKYAGAINKSDLHLMEISINENCGKIDYDEW